jgi:hypothetical protein
MRPKHGYTLLDILRSMQEDPELAEKRRLEDEAYMRWLMNRFYQGPPDVSGYDLPPRRGMGFSNNTKPQNPQVPLGGFEAMGEFRRRPYNGYF